MRFVWPAVLGLIAGVAVFLIALTSGRFGPRVAGQPVADATMVSSFAANIVLLLVAILALIVRRTMFAAKLLTIVASNIVLLLVAILALIVAGAAYRESR